MIFHKHQAIFFHIGKTAGTSVETWMHDGALDPSKMRRSIMWGYDPDERMFLQHATPKFTQEIVGSHLIEVYSNFTIVRNPFARIVSVYRYLEDAYKKQYGGFANFLRALDKLSRDKSAFKGSHFSPQSIYVSLDGQFICDFIGHFEEIDTTSRRIAKHFGIKTGFPSINVNSKPKDQTIADVIHGREAVDIITNVYADDFALFGYEPTPEYSAPRPIELPLRAQPKLSIIEGLAEKLGIVRTRRW